MESDQAVELAASILRTFDAVTATGEAVQRHAEETEAEVARLWQAIAELRDDQHEGLGALSNRLQNLTTAVTTDPAEVATAVVKRMHEVRLRPRGLGDGAVAMCNCGWRSEEMATESAALAHGHYHVQEVT